MQLSKDEWRATSERAAAASYGERHARRLRFQRFGAARVGIVLAVGAFGLGAWWLYSHLVRPIFSGAGLSFGGHLPVAFVLVVVAALIGTIAAFRVSVPTAPFLLVRGVLVGFVWLGIVAFGAALLV